MEATPISTGKVVASQLFPGAIGAQLANVPRHSFNSWTTYELPWHLEIGGGGNFVDKRTASSTVPLDPTTHLVKEVPAYWVFNLFAKYPLGERFDLQANIYNIADRYYFDEPHPNHVVLGAGRSALIGINFKF